VNRLPIRIRLTLLFALAMAMVLSAVGVFLYVRLGDSLIEQLDESLEARAETLAQVAQEESPFRSLGGDEEFAQLIGADGSVVASTSGLENGPLLSGGDLDRARNREIFIERQLDLSTESSVNSRLLAVPVDGGAILVVGASLSDRDEALDGLLAQLILGGPIALLLASGAAYMLASAALRPVELMRTRAGEISAETAGRRLPLPSSRDEIHRLGKTLNEMLHRLDEGLRRERRFVADAGHELRTPLALLQTELELALRRPRTADELEAAVRSASEEVDRLTRLAEDLLVLASTEDGALPLSVSIFPAAELLDGAARRFSIRTRETGRTLDINAPDELAIYGDRLRLEQAVANLVDNAFQHGAGDVSVEADRIGDEVVIHVSDEGEGFDTEFVQHAFERFSRADEARQRGGAGLGLAIVAAVARAHGGTAEAEGSRVAIRLPAEPLDAAAEDGNPRPTA
jgi:two-component system, OmpR family, sensor kinase